MKFLFLAVLTLAATALRAQKNPFLDAAFWKNNPTVETIRAEIGKGNNPAESNAMGFDAVVNAINAKASTEAIKFLLEQKGNEVNKITHDGRTYVFWAASRGNVEIVEYLISKGAQVNGEDSHGMTPLGFAAAAQASTQIYDALIKAGANVKWKNAGGASLLLLAIANDKDLSLTNYFISKGLSLQATDAAGNTAFDYAVRSGNTDLLKTLVQKGVKYTGNAMVMATQVGRGGNANGPEVYQYLESLGLKPAFVNAQGENALHNLVRRPGQTALIQYFLSKGANPNQADQDGNTPFMNAAYANRDTTTLALLLPHVKNINQVNKKGVSALAGAVRSNSADIVGYLLRKGADLQVQDRAGNNLAYYLIQSYNPQAGERQQPGAPARDEFGAKTAVLQQAGYNLAAPQKDGSTLYHLAVVKNDLSLLKQLEKMNVDVNARNAEGLTALHKAAMVAKDDAILKYLLSLGAKKDVTTEYKETAFDLARENENFTRQKLSIEFLK